MKEEIIKILVSQVQANPFITILVLIGFIVSGAITFFSKNYEVINYILFRKYRFRRMESNKTISESLEEINDDNLKLLYQDTLKKEAFEKVTRMNFYGTKKRELFLKLYPKIKSEIGYEELHELKKHILIKKDTLYVLGRYYYLIQDALYFSLVGTLIIGAYVVFSLFTKEVHVRFDITILVPLFLLLGLFIIKIDTSNKAGKLRVLLEKHYGAVS